MSEDTALTVVPSVLESALSITDILAQVKLIQEVMKAVMKEDEHYGVIPGCKKPSLLKPGAEKLCLTFRFDPQYQSTERYDGTHLTVKSICTLWHIPSGRRIASGEGSCSTKESKYAYRDSKRKCPECDKETIIKGKEEYGGGWLCFQKKGGCGAKFADGDESIEKQVIGRTPNEDVADQYNTILKMANKRSLVAAVLNGTAASDIFTQDMEDIVEATAHVKAEAAAPAQPPEKKAGLKDTLRDRASKAVPQDAPAQHPALTALDTILRRVKTRDECQTQWKQWSERNIELPEDVYSEGGARMNQRFKELPA